MSHSQQAPATTTPTDASADLLTQAKQMWSLYGKPYWRQATGAITAILAIWLVIGVAKGVAQNTLAKGFSAVAAAETTDELTDVARKYKGTQAGAQAETKLARMLFAEGKFDQAATRFSVLISEYPKSELIDSARLGEAFALEADEKTIQAEKRFEELATAAQDGGIRLESLLGAARCARLQNKLAVAADQLQKALAAVPADDSQRSKDVQILISEVERLRSAPPAPEAEGAAPEKAPTGSQTKSTDGPAPSATGSATK
ncbi:MAG: hypothetical protein HN742_07355 [Lentisphaerae bacterium]|jgi:tetratricopeptide (TPR) repeat protein|nr:hypothetical protein [Lentisphaerota bacterium]MBT4819161.1 hypothetical protein [Lentisphaerota bacterium]MBT5607344.1 hypothetical protein [Lentisphaerota bacterium]MBT7058354.1 hypothetical protein [Lentisphaerota bacterium]MBT7841671.1 hypothetical protein [Lentisphaerota bacterium]